MQSGYIDLTFFSSIGSDGRIVFPKLEELFLPGPYDPNEDVCNEILRAARLRKNIPDISPIKLLALYEGIIPYSLGFGFEEELQSCVDTINWLT